MPLHSGYGVVIGTLHRYYADPPEDYGEYYHANVQVMTPRGVYRCKLDVDGKTNAGLLWRVVEFGASDLKGVAAMPDGWHRLDSTRNSGALDYLRSPELRCSASSSVTVTELASAPAAVVGPAGTLGWRRGTRQEALADLEALLDDPARLFVYGEPFVHGRGVHNVHQNQGDPSGTEWAAENGVWQDGALVVRRRSGALAAYLAKYATQSDRTDRHGHPAGPNRT